SLCSWFSSRHDQLNGHVHKLVLTEPTDSKSLSEGACHRARRRSDGHRDGFGCPRGQRAAHGEVPGKPGLAAQLLDLPVEDRANGPRVLNKEGLARNSGEGAG